MGPRLIVPPAPGTRFAVGVYRVLDFTRVLAGPWATQMLGDQGFDVIKVEALDGDETRRFLPDRDGESVYFACTNRNKRSIAVDLKRPPPRLGEHARTLLAEAGLSEPEIQDLVGTGVVHQD